MSISKYIKRLVKYVIYGEPNINIKTAIYQVNYGQTFKNKAVLITGGSRGIGYEIAKKCINEGAKVVILGRNKERLDIVKEDLGEDCEVIQYDLRNTSEIDDVIIKSKELLRVKRFDCLVNCAGVSIHGYDFETCTEEVWDETFNINLKSTYFITQSFVKQWEESNSSSECSIVNISSERGLFCDDRPYGLSKVALNSFTRGLARRLITRNIRVNAVAPGITATDMSGFGKDTNLYTNYSAGKRIFLPEEVSELVCFLLSDVSKSVSGEVIACDQGTYLRSDW